MNRVIQDLLFNTALDRSNDPAFYSVIFAITMLGTREVGGDNKGELIEAMQATVDANNDGTPWCLSFLQSAIAFSERMTNVKTNFPNIAHCLTLWNEAQDYKVAIPKLGDIVIWQKDGTQMGHAGIILSVLPNGYYTIEGNTSNGVGIIDRNGDGVFMRFRQHGGMHTMTELGFLRPFSTK